MELELRASPAPIVVDQPGYEAVQQRELGLAIAQHRGLRHPTNEPDRRQTGLRLSHLQPGDPID